MHIEVTEALQGFEERLSQEKPGYIADLDQRSADTREFLRDLGVDVEDREVAAAVTCFALKIDSEARRLQREEGVEPVKSFGQAAIHLVTELTHMVANQRVN